jgi:small subunit ribosomal protein S13
MAEPKEDKKMQLLVRVANTDLDGKKQLVYALRKIKGVNVSFAAALCNHLNIPQEKKAGYLEADEIKRLTEAIQNPPFPGWMLNRTLDRETGDDRHLILGDLQFTQENDVKRLAKMKANRGLRHQWKLPVRGQRTSSNFRKSKSKLATAAKKGRRKGA